MIRAVVDRGAECVTALLKAVDMSIELTFPVPGQRVGVVYRFGYQFDPQTYRFILTRAVSVKLLESRPLQHQSQFDPLS